MFLLVPDTKERIEPFLKWEMQFPCVPSAGQAARLTAGKNKQGCGLLSVEVS